MEQPTEVTEQRKPGRYQGKPENFDPAKAKPRPKPIPVKPKAKGLPPPTNLSRNVEPTAQRNDSIIAEAIFSPDISVVEIEPRQEFNANLSKIIDVSDQIYENLRPDNRFLERELEKVELRYYSTALLWLRLIDIKSKQGRVGLTTQERAISRESADFQFNIPKPLFAYLSSLGAVKDKMGKTTYLNIPDLPIVQAAGRTGYHAANVTAENDNLFEEVPTLGITADVIQSISVANPVPPVYGVAPPPNAILTNNLIGLEVEAQLPPRLEIVRRLQGMGINQNQFPEFTPNTRFNSQYLRSISDILSKFETFKMDKTSIPSMTMIGQNVCAIRTRPQIAAELQNWRQRTVEPISSAEDSSAQMGASYVFGFQLYKENSEQQGHLAYSNWSSVAPGVGENPWVMPDAWLATRNQRRDLPAGLGTDRFRAVLARQDVVTDNVIRRFIVTKR